VKVDGPRPVDTLRTTRVRAPGGAASGFAPESAAGPKTPAPASGTAVISSVDALIALQEVPDPTTGRAKAARRGRDMLDVLDDVRDGLLSGSISRATLQRLLTLVNVQREDFIDPDLSAVIDEIELRARVELAKLNFAGAN
jgi:class II flagellar assembly regulator FliX